MHTLVIFNIHTGHDVAYVVTSTDRVDMMLRFFAYCEDHGKDAHELDYELL